MSDERVNIPSAWGVRGFSVEVRFLRECLERQGYALVPAADVPTPEERAVLAFADCVDWNGDGPDPGQLELLAEAYGALQLARRVSKESK